jgi:hypothetical protein
MGVLWSKEMVDIWPVLGYTVVRLPYVRFIITIY